ncbi:MAG TPA: peptidoglycan editing factor PgeF [Gammaproteobacteria bacterium]|nr:peptidoglycan editing factor PgeF [Gammaproteobacteria bacterium]
MNTALSPSICITANWPAVSSVRALTTLRAGGYSVVPYAGFNLAAHVGDCIDNVLRNRLKLHASLRLAHEPIWLNQHHGTTVIDAWKDQDRDADGAYADKPSVVCAVLTADCLPLLLCSEEGNEIAALHCGWRGLAAGIIEQGLKRFHSPRHQLLAWLGPAISARHYEVGGEVRQAFAGYGAEVAAAFSASRVGHYRADLYAIARVLLNQGGVKRIYGGTCCTYAEHDRFFSFRRDGETGRMASLIWINPAST